MCVGLHVCVHLCLFHCGAVFIGSFNGYTCTHAFPSPARKYEIFILLPFCIPISVGMAGLRKAAGVSQASTLEKKYLFIFLIVYLNSFLY